MKEKIKDRLEYLKELKKDMMELYLASNDELVRTSINERNMQVSMEISFLNELLQYDVSNRREQLIAFKTWEIDNDIKNLLPDQLADFYLENSN